MDKKQYINPNNPVYISYAWGEDLEIDVNKLCELMDANGIYFKRDKAKGENSLCPYRYNIIDAEEEIGKGKAIIVVISDKYIKSLNCMYEWHCICKTGNIAQRVFPIVLPGTKLRQEWRYDSFRKHFEKRLREISDKEVGSSIDAIERKLLDNDGYLKDLETLRDHLKENIIPDLKSLQEDDYFVIIQQLKEYITKIEDSKKKENPEEKKETFSEPFFKNATQSNIVGPEIKANVKGKKDAVIEIANGNQSNCHCLTSPPSDADFSTVIGRENDLEKLWKKLSEKKHVMLTGLGGIGKTKLAQMLFHNYRDRFEEVAWIKYKEDLRHSFSYHIEKYQDVKDPWEAMMNDLHNDGKKKLFIIDNVDDDADQRPENDKDLRNLTGWKDTTILLTSRSKELTPYIQHKLKALSKDGCKAVFNHYYGYDSDPELVDKIVKLANYHTLTIELLAKGAKRENLESYYEKIKGGFEAVSRKMSTEHHDGNVTIEGHLRCLFDIQKRPEADKKVLNSFAVLSVNCECSLEEIEQWFGFGNEDLDEVIKDGWLSFDENKQTFSMHPLIRTIIRFDFLADGQGKKAIAPEGTTDKVLEYFDEHRELDLFDINMGFVSLQRMIDIVESVIGAVDEKESVRFARLYHRIGWSYRDLGDYNKALEYYEKALEIKESKLGKDDTDTASTYNGIAGVYVDMGDYDKALEYYEKDRKISESKLGKDHPDTATTYNNIALVYDSMGDYDKALDYYEKAKDIYESKLGKDHPYTATTYNNIAGVYKAKGDYDKALEYYEKALEISESKLGKDHPYTATTYNNIGDMYSARGDYDKALEYYEKALEIRESKLGKDHPDTATTYNNIALVYKAKGDYAKALEYYEKALKIRESKLGKDHPDTATTYNNIAGVYYAKGEYDMALVYYKKALEIRESKLGKEHPDTATTYNNIAWVFRAKGDYDKALEFLLKALKIWLNRDVNHTDTKLYFIYLTICYKEANMEKDFVEWLKEQLNEKEWKVLLELIKSL